jgi:hypothetical protein
VHAAAYASRQYRTHASHRAAAIALRPTSIGTHARDKHRASARIAQASHSHTHRDARIARYRHLYVSMHRQTVSVPSDKHRISRQTDDKYRHSRITASTTQTVSTRAVRETDRQKRQTDRQHHWPHYCRHDRQTADAFQTDRQTVSAQTGHRQHLTFTALT